MRRFTASMGFNTFPVYPCVCFSMDELLSGEKLQIVFVSFLSSSISGSIVTRSILACLQLRAMKCNQEEGIPMSGCLICLSFCLLPVFVLKTAEILSWVMVQVLGERGKERQTALVHHKHLCDAAPLALNFVGDEV